MIETANTDYAAGDNIDYERPITEGWLWAGIFSEKPKNDYFCFVFLVIDQK